MKNLSQYSALSIIILVFSAFILPTEVPKDWFKAGSKPNNYSMTLDKTILKTGSSSATIKSLKDEKSGFGTLMQTCNAAEYLGKKVKMSGYIKSENIEGWAGMWLRIDSKGEGKSIGFDNMRNRPIKGTQDWTYCEIILKVPVKAATLNYGALLKGQGQIWFDELKFEVVDNNVETTNRNKLSKPANLGFEE